MPAGRPPGGPAVPVASQVLDPKGRLMPEYTQFLRELATYADDIADAAAVSAMAMAKPGAASGGGGLATIPADLSVNTLAIGMPPTLASYPLDLRDGTASQVHIASTPGDDGTYILSTMLFGMPTTYISSGCAWDGVGNWIAKDTSASILVITPTAFGLLYNSGLMVGSTFTPLTAVQVNFPIPTSNPGVGTKQVWCDTANSNVLKLA